MNLHLFMDKTELYNKLDIEHIGEFRYYENLASLMEEDDYIDNTLITELVKDVDKEVFAEHLDSYFEDFLKHIPDEESELYITVDSIRTAMEGMLSDEMDSEDVGALAEEISKFRKWYVHDRSVFDRISGEELSVRDARYNIVAAGFLGEKYDYDFGAALDYDLDGYDVRIAIDAGKTGY